jgi:hypothetical protein
MTYVEYNILSSNIRVVVDATAASATICWRYSATITSDDGCNENTIIDTTCTNVEIEPNNSCEEKETYGSITWNGLVINYTIVQKGNEEYCDKCGEDNVTYELIRTWVQPSVIKCNESISPTLYYSYYETTENNCGIERKRLTGYTTVALDCEESEEPTRKEGTATIAFGDTVSSVTFTYVCDSCDQCIPNSVKIKVGNVYFDEEYVTCTGGTVHYKINYKKTEFDRECNKKVTNGVAEGTWNVPPCTEHCCEDHMATGIINIEGQNVDISILMKADYDNTCGTCNCVTEHKTTYCTSSDGKVYYPKKDQYGNTTWSEEGSVPFFGGTIKVKFSYTATTTFSDCTTGVSKGTYEELIVIPMLDCTKEQPTHDIVIDSCSYDIKPSTEVDCSGGRVTFNAVPKNNS